MWLTGCSAGIRREWLTYWLVSEYQQESLPPQLFSITWTETIWRRLYDAKQYDLPIPVKLLQSPLVLALELSNDIDSYVKIITNFYANVPRLQSDASKMDPKRRLAKSSLTHWMLWRDSCTTIRWWSFLRNCCNVGSVFPNPNWVAEHCILRSTTNIRDMTIRRHLHNWKSW